jgi:hypothetical protein
MAVFSLVTKVLKGSSLKAVKTHEVAPPSIFFFLTHFSSDTRRILPETLTSLPTPLNPELV